MKCWKCGQENVQNVSQCVYCGAGMNRPEPETEIGAALRKLYDHYGCEAMLTNPLLMVNGLGDLVQDSGKFRSQLKMALDAGIGKIYLEQIRTAGKPDRTFDSRVLTILIEDAELSEAAANKIMDAMDEMIGWQASVQIPTRSVPEESVQMPVQENRPRGAEDSLSDFDSVKKSRVPVILITLLVIAAAAFLIANQSGGWIPVPWATATPTPTPVSETPTPTPVPATPTLMVTPDPRDFEWEEDEELQKHDDSQVIPDSPAPASTPESSEVPTQAPITSVSDIKIGSSTVAFGHYTDENGQVQPMLWKIINKMYSVSNLNDKNSPETSQLLMICISDLPWKIRYKDIPDGLILRTLSEDIKDLVHKPDKYSIAAYLNALGLYMEARQVRIGTFDTAYLYNIFTKYNITNWMTPRILNDYTVSVLNEKEYKYYTDLGYLDISGSRKYLLAPENKNEHSNGAVADNGLIIYPADDSEAYYCQPVIWLGIRTLDTYLQERK